MINAQPDFIPHKFIIRDAQEQDLDDICELGKLLNTVNLPADKNELKKVIARSEASFSSQEQDIASRAFLFALVNAQNKVIGCSQIFAKHGTLESPQVFFQISQDERYSKTLNKYFRHRVMRLTQSFDGPTEMGSLVLHKNYRSIPEKLGQQLSYVRFLFLGMQPQLFSHRVVAELLPPLGPKFESELWEAVGRKFTGLDYYEADSLSRENKEFVETLFPRGAIYVSLLPQKAQDVIGQVGRNSKGAAHLLSKIGFRYSHKVDPFDGGPHFEAEQKDIKLIKKALHGQAHSVGDHVPHIGDSALHVGMVGYFNAKLPSGQRFVSIYAAYHYESDEGRIYVHENTLKALGASEGDSLTVIDRTLF